MRTNILTQPLYSLEWSNSTCLPQSLPFILIICLGWMNTLVFFHLHSSAILTCCLTSKNQVRVKKKTKLGICIPVYQTMKIVFLHQGVDVASHHIVGSWEKWAIHKNAMAGDDALRVLAHPVLYISWSSFHERHFMEN